MTEQISPRRTYLKIADTLKAQIESQPSMATLPSASEIIRLHGVSRGVALRVFGVLERDGLAEKVPGARWRVVRDSGQVDRRPLADQIAAVITDDRIEVGAEFPSMTSLCKMFGVSRPTVRRALDKLEAQGLLSEGGQGKATYRTGPAEPRGAFPALTTMGLTTWAYPLAEPLLAEPLPRRWKHSLGVAQRARNLAAVLGADADLLEAAAVLHDVGYSPELAKTGLGLIRFGGHPRSGVLPREDVHHGEYGEEEASPSPLVHAGVQGRGR